MPPTLHASLHFAHQDVEELLRAHLEAQGYYVESVAGDDDQGWDVQVRPMSPEERVTSGLPGQTTEERLHTKLDEVVATLAQHASDTDEVMSARLRDLENLTTVVSDAMLEVRDLTKNRTATAPIFAPMPEGNETPAYPTEAAKAYLTGAPVAPPAKPSEPSYESLSFADAAGDLRVTKKEDPDAALRRANFAELRADIEHDASVIEATAGFDTLEGASSEFPSSHAIT